MLATRRLSRIRWWATIKPIEPVANHDTTHELTMKGANIGYAASLTHVREVSLFGTADLAFWKHRLDPEGLIPAEKHGKARLMIIAADAKFMGIRFRELSFSVLAADHSGQHGAFLVQAFNSSRLFACCERVIFSTPYTHGDVRVSAAFPPSVRLTKDGSVVFLAEMKSDAAAPGRAPTRSEEDGWEGPVFLPSIRNGKRRSAKWFFAKIRGHTETYPFLNSHDTLMIYPSPRSEILQALIDSQFTAIEWAVRADAMHAKSKTYDRSELSVRVAGL